jgi:hypothetical protein
MAFVHIVRKIEHLDVSSSGIFANEFPGMHPSGWTKQALITLEEAMEMFIGKSANRL